MLGTDASRCSTNRAASLIYDALRSERLRNLAVVDLQKEHAADLKPYRVKCWSESLPAPRTPPATSQSAANRYPWDPSLWAANPAIT